MAKEAIRTVQARPATYDAGDSVHEDIINPYGSGPLPIGPRPEANESLPGRRQ
ncbi:hypothetical protein N177_1738 [Lutibaculum baratangense AMV1]|uniref:Uncharacterized protein n=1 Tax=Lutibaculum baratangense AMV1 TaxID=631454 RepID=V4THD5_9HYPH|nr:hypothetical protein N177_1738 [Lutibaculum baratangense AMV1]